jgi:cytochrome c oxidase subunit 4
MATDTHATAAAHGPADGHSDAGHGAHGADHHPHVLPLSVYFGVFAALVVFTVITVGVSYLDLGAANLFIAMLVATCKALMVSAIFMHLAFDKKFNAVIFSFSLLFLAIFISFTLFDTNYRGLGGRLSTDRPLNIGTPFEGTKQEAALKAEYAPKAEGTGEGAKGEGGEQKAAPAGEAPKAPADQAPKTEGAPAAPAGEAAPR